MGRALVTRLWPPRMKSLGRQNLPILLSAIAVVLSGVALLLSLGIPGVDQTSSTSFEVQVRRYLMDNPEVLLESVQRLEERRRAAADGEAKTAIIENREELFRSEASPVAGNPSGDVTVVEFFDYNCPYCRRAAPILFAAAAADEGLRVVFKEWPILGPGSRFAARAALASRAQGKYEAFHKALMAHRGAIDEDATLEIGRAVGLDVERLKFDMEDAAVDAELDRNFALADALRIDGTPTFVVGEEIARGLIELPALQELIAAARAKPGG